MAGHAGGTLPRRSLEALSEKPRPRSIKQRHVSDPDEENARDMVLVQQDLKDRKGL